jgi:hypothetical protein
MCVCVCVGDCRQLLNERHEFDVITKWTLSLDGTVFAFSRDDGVIVYLVSPQVCCVVVVAYLWRGCSLFVAWL